MQFDVVEIMGLYLIEAAATTEEEILRKEDEQPAVQLSSSPSNGLLDVIRLNGFTNDMALTFDIVCSSTSTDTTDSNVIAKEQITMQQADIGNERHITHSLMDSVDGSCC